eukprot:jgi/Orpsp1_1/1174623/evm.model.c7180000050786.1
MQQLQEQLQLDLDLVKTIRIIIQALDLILETRQILLVQVFLVLIIQLIQALDYLVPTIIIVIVYSNLIQIRVLDYLVQIITILEQVYLEIIIIIQVAVFLEIIIIMQVAVFLEIIIILVVDFLVQIQQVVVDCLEIIIPNQVYLVRLQQQVLVEEWDNNSLWVFLCFNSIQQAQQHTSTVADELRKIQEYWNPQSPNCQFKHYFYNMVHPSEVNRYVKPPNDDEGLWRQAQKNNPDSSCMVPALAIGFDGIKKRMAEQSKQTNAHEAKLKELADKVEKLRQKHLLETTGKLEEYRRRHLSLAHRTLKIMKQVYILRNRGYSIRPEEETLKVRLENLATSLRKSSQFRGRVEELWAHLQMIRDHPGASWYNLASASSTNMNNNNNNSLNGNINNNINKLSSTGKGNGNLAATNNNSNLVTSGANIKNGEINTQPGRYVVDEEGLQTIHKILTEHQHGLSILTDYVKKNSKEIEDMYRGYHEPGPHYQSIQQNRLDQHYPNTLSSTSSLTLLK